MSMAFKVKVVTGYGSEPWEHNLLDSLGIDRINPDREEYTFDPDQLATIFCFNHVEVYKGTIKITIGAF